MIIQQVLSRYPHGYLNGAVAIVFFMIFLGMVARTYFFSSDGFTSKMEKTPLEESDYEQ